MEKDFTKENLNLDDNPDDSPNYSPIDSPNEDEKDQELARIEYHMLLRAKFQSMEDQIKETQKAIERNFKAMEYLEKNISSLQTLPNSPIGMPPLNSPEFAFLDQACATIVDLKKALAMDSCLNTRESFERTEKTKSDALCNSPQKTLENETQTTESNASSDLETDENSDRYHTGKGKEAANPAFRYKKRSKTDARSDSCVKAESSGESLAKESVVEHSEETFRSPKTLDRQSSNVERKRKGSDHKEKGFDGSCAKSTVVSNLPENHADEDLTISKKKKYENENIFKSAPTLTDLLLRNDYKSYDWADFIRLNQQTDETSYEGEQVVPSISGQSNIVGSSSEESSSQASGSDYTMPSDRQESSLTGASDIAASLGESRDYQGAEEDKSQLVQSTSDQSIIVESGMEDSSFHASGSGYTLFNDREDSSRTSASDIAASLSESWDYQGTEEERSQLVPTISGQSNLVGSSSEDSSSFHTSGSGYSLFSDREDSSRTSASDIAASFSESWDYHGAEEERSQVVPSISGQLNIVGSSSEDSSSFHTSGSGYTLFRVREESSLTSVSDVAASLSESRDYQGAED